MALRIIKAVRDKGTTVHVYARDDDGGKVELVVPFRPYFLVLEDEAVDSSLLTDCEFGDFTSLWGERLRKVFTANPSDVPAARSLFSKHWEADIPYGRRALVDLKLTAGCDDDLQPAESSAKLVIWHLDIECHGADKMPDAEKDFVTCWSLHDGTAIVTAILDDVDFEYQDGENAELHFTTEKRLLERLLELLEKESPDVLASWHTFDVEYLEKRCEKYKLDWYNAVVGSNVFDLLSSYRHLYRRKSYRLKDIALDEGLTTEEEPKVNYAAMWRDDKQGLIERNQHHVQWCAAIEQKHGVIAYFWELKELTGLSELDDAMHASILIETLLLRRAAEHGVVLPSKREFKREEYEGGYVMEPIPGVYSGVAEYDATRMYSTIILNEMLDPGIFSAYTKQQTGNLNWAEYKAFTEQYIAAGKPALLLEVVGTLVAERIRLQALPEHKDKLMAVKGILNAAYGVCGSPHFRLFTPEIAARITEVARNIIRMLGDEVSRSGYKVIMCDTDSNWVVVPKCDVERVAQLMASKLTALGDYSMKLEGYYTRVLVEGKKRYAAISENGELKIRGFEWRRSDSSNYTRQLQEDVLRMILEGHNDAVLPYLKQKVLGVKDASLLDISVAKTVTRELDSYTDGAQHYIKSLQDSGADVHAGDAVRMIPALNYPHGIAVFQDVTDLTVPPVVDYAKVIDSQIKRKVSDILVAAGLSWDEVIGKRRLF